VVESRCGGSGGGVKVRRVAARCGAPRACASATGGACRVWMEWTGGVGAYIPTGVGLGFAYMQASKQAYMPK
jgi:hypothetical protein